MLLMNDYAYVITRSASARRREGDLGSMLCPNLVIAKDVKSLCDINSMSRGNALAIVMRKSRYSSLEKSR